MESPKSRFFEKISIKLKDDNGSASVEFALMVPAVLLILLSISYAVDIIMLRNKVAAAADAVASVAAMDSDITSAEMAAIFKAGAALLEPAASGASLKLTSVVPSGTLRVVAWSDAIGRSPDAVGTAYAFPAGAAASFGAENDKSVLVATVTVNYTSAVANVLRSLSPLGNFATVYQSFSEQSFALPVGVGDRRWTGRSP